MEWVLKSPNFKYLKSFQESIDPDNPNELLFKEALGWALSTLVEQAEVLSEIEVAYNSDITIPPPPPKPKPTFKVIQGGKSDFPRAT